MPHDGAGREAAAGTGIRAPPSLDKDPSRPLVRKLLRLRPFAPLPLPFTPTSPVQSGPSPPPRPCSSGLGLTQRTSSLSSSHIRIQISFLLTFSHAPPLLLGPAFILYHSPVTGLKTPAVHGLLNPNSSVLEPRSDTGALELLREPWTRPYCLTTPHLLTSPLRPARYWAVSPEVGATPLKPEPGIQIHNPIDKPRPRRLTSGLETQFGPYSLILAIVVESRSSRRWPRP